MKKIFVGFLFVVMMFMFVACGTQNKETEVTNPSAPNVEATDVGTQNPKDTAADNSEDVYEGMAGMINPWVDSDQAGVLEATGFNLTAPAGAANVAYSYMPSTGMAQLNYVIENARWIYRMQPTDALEDISGIYCDWNYTEETKVAGMDAMVYSWASETDGNTLDGMDCTRMINWYDAQNKVTCSLVAGGNDLNGMDITVYAEKLIALASN